DANSWFAGLCRLASVASSALDQRVVEDGVVVVLVRDDGELGPGAGVVDAFVVGLGSKVLCVDRRERVTGAVHASCAVAATDHRDELVGPLVVVGCDELDQGLLWGSSAQEGDDVFPVASPFVLADRLAKPDLDCALGACRAEEHAVSRVVIATARPAVGLSVAFA